MTLAHLQTLPISAPASRGFGRSARAAGLLLFVLSAQFMTAIMLAASIAPGYDYRGAAISDLGVSNETAWLFNGSLVIVGTLNAVAGYLLFRSHGRPWLLMTFILGGIGAAGAGLLPLDRSELHGAFALTAFVFFNIEAIGSGLIVSNAMRPISVTAGVIGLTFVALMIVGDSMDPAVFGVIGHGAAERMIVYPVLLWMMAFGGYLLAHRADADGSGARRQIWRSGTRRSRRWGSWRPASAADG